MNKLVAASLGAIALVTVLTPGIAHAQDDDAPYGVLVDADPFEPVDFTVEQQGARSDVFCAQVISGGKGYCESSATLVYRPNGGGSNVVLGYRTPVGQAMQWAKFADLSPYKFLSAGDGKGQPVRNNTSYWYNRHGVGTSTYVNMWMYTSFKGPSDTLPPARSATLVNTRNNNASLNTSVYAR